mmetsp:Transcript_35017/g.104429  ORF Transcript_35017/g.104429 Transcript_35017/m.104429 type:complete len:158 (-) Transcript_35017:355-828(-)
MRRRRWKRSFRRRRSEFHTQQEYRKATSAADQVQLSLFHGKACVSCVYSCIAIPAGRTNEREALRSVRRKIRFVLGILPHEEKEQCSDAHFTQHSPHIHTTKPCHSGTRPPPPQSKFGANWTYIRHSRGGSVKTLGLIETSQPPPNSEYGLRGMVLH